MIILFYLSLIPQLVGCLTSSQSSVVSTGSIKQRRLHPAADTLTLTLQPPSEDTIGTRDGVSPLYMEPYDILDTCCHGTKSHVECSACQQELDTILSQCDQFLNNN